MDALPSSGPWNAYGALATAITDKDEGISAETLVLRSGIVDAVAEAAKDRIQRQDNAAWRAQESMIMGAASAAAGLMFFGFFYGVGWIVAGFMRDE